MIQLALLLFDCGQAMLDALPQSMRHLKQGEVPPSNQESVQEEVYFYWAKEGPVIHPFQAPHAPSHSNTCLGGNLSPLTVYLDTPPAGLEEQHISCYAQAVRNVLQHPFWQTALFEVLQVDQLVTPGQPWLLNPHAVVTAAPPGSPTIASLQPSPQHLSSSSQSPTISGPPANTSSPLNAPQVSAGPSLSQNGPSPSAASPKDPQVPSSAQEPTENSPPVTQITPPSPTRASSPPAPQTEGNPALGSKNKRRSSLGSPEGKEKSRPSKKPKRLSAEKKNDDEEQEEEEEEEEEEDQQLKNMNQDTSGKNKGKGNATASDQMDIDEVGILLQ